MSATFGKSTRCIKQCQQDMMFLESLNMAKMVTSRLNPLRVCQPAVVQNFSAITRQYQLAYCTTIIEHNSRYTLPTIYQDEKGAVVTSNNILDAFYPFDPYILEKSFKKIEPFYLEYQENCESMDVESPENTLSEEQKDAEVDDFLYNNEDSTPTNSKTQKFSYGSSPGFKFKI